MTLQKRKRLTVGHRAILVKAKKDSLFFENVGHEVLLTKRSGPQFSILVLKKGKNIPLKRSPKTVVGGGAWIEEYQLKFVDDNFQHNLDFIDWYEDHKNDYCQSCDKKLRKKDKNEDLCNKCAKKWGYL